MKDSDRTIEVLAEDHENTFDVTVTISDEVGQETRFEMRCTETEYVGIQRAAERSQAVAGVTRILPTLEVER